MLTILWLLIWLSNGTPQLEAWNNWAIALGICLFIDFINNK